jgi:hypothetical protein
MCRAHLPLPSLVDNLYYIQQHVFSFWFLGGLGGGGERGIWGCQEFLHHALLGQHSDNEKVVLMNAEVELEWVKLECTCNCFDTKHKLFYYYFLNENNFFEIEATAWHTIKLFLFYYFIIL